MNVTVAIALLTALAGPLGLSSAKAQDATRGAALYRSLPGQPGVGSCTSCHGEPVNNRNSVLRGAAGPELISKTIAAVSAMGYLRQAHGQGINVPGGELQNWANLLFLCWVGGAAAVLHGREVFGHGGQQAIASWLTNQFPMAM